MSIRTNINRFWKVFSNEKSNLEKALVKKQTNEVNEIKKILSTYFEELCNCSLEIEEDDGIFEMTFLTDNDKNAQIICALLKQSAPSDVQRDWIIHASLPPLSNKALTTILKLKDQEYGLDNFVVFYDIDPASRCLDVRIYCDAFSVLDPNKANEVAIYMLELAIGETYMEAYINTMNVVTEKESGVNMCLLSHFYENIVDIIEEQKWTDYSDCTSIYRAFHLSENKAIIDVRRDMKIIYTIHPLLMSEVLNDEYYEFQKFFDFGGEFGYLYYEHDSNESVDAYFRQRLEKQIHDLLYPMGVARSIGGAMGIKYAYIDLAIFDKTLFLKMLDKINAKLNIKLAYKSFHD